MRDPGFSFSIHCRRWSASFRCWGLWNRNARNLIPTLTVFRGKGRRDVYVNWKLLNLYLGWRTKSV